MFQPSFVDHIIPEWLADEPEELARVLERYDLPADFNLNSYENWRPACSACNGRKVGRVFNPAPIILEELHRARDKADECRKREDAGVRDAEISKALVILERAVDRNELPYEKMEPLITAYALSNPDALRAVRQPPRDNGDFLALMVVPQLRLAPDLTVYFIYGGVRYGLG